MKTYAKNKFIEKMKNITVPIKTHDPNRAIMSNYSPRLYNKSKR